MTGSFDGNDGNDANAANSGGGGNATSIQAGWFFADRIGLPFVTILDSGPISTNTPIAALRTNVKTFPARNWSAEWTSWLALTEFVQTTGWNAVKLLPAWMAGRRTLRLVAGSEPNCHGRDRRVGQCRTGRTRGRAW